jgi:hypothetical protein
MQAPAKADFLASFTPKIVWWKLRRFPKLRPFFTDARLDPKGCRAANNTILLLNVGYSKKQYK